jgi:hypothetical protein
MSFQDLLKKMSVASVVEADNFFVASYTLVIVDTQEKGYYVYEPVLLVKPKSLGDDFSIIYRNQVNRIPVTIFK